MPLWASLSFVMMSVEGLGSESRCRSISKPDWLYKPSKLDMDWLAGVACSIRLFALANDLLSTSWVALELFRNQGARWSVFGGVALAQLVGTIGTVKKAWGSIAQLVITPLEPIEANTCALLRRGTPLKPEHLHF